MIEQMYEQDNIHHVRVDTEDDLMEAVKQHGGLKSDGNGLPRGIDTPEDSIGQATCNDGLTIRFHASDAGTATKLWENRCLGARSPIQLRG